MKDSSDCPTISGGKRTKLGGGKHSRRVLVFRNIEVQQKQCFFPVFSTCDHWHSFETQNLKSAFLAAVTHVSTQISQERLVLQLHTCLYVYKPNDDAWINGCEHSFGFEWYLKLSFCRPNPKFLGEDLRREYLWNFLRQSCQCVIICFA